MYVVEKHTNHAVYAFRVRNEETGETQGSGMTGADALRLADLLNGH